MKFLKILVSLLLILGIVVLTVWAGIKANNKSCTAVSIRINDAGESALLSKSDILLILEHNHIECEGKPMKEFDLSSIYRILANENFIKSVDKVHFLGSKLHIEITLYDILLEVETQNRQNFLLDVEGICLPYSPKIKNDVIVCRGCIPDGFRKKELITPDNYELYELFVVASFIRNDPFYAPLFQKLYINEKQEIILQPSVGNLPVLFGSMQQAEQKLKTLKYMYEEVLPYVEENKYVRMDVRFTNRIVATKNRT